MNNNDTHARTRQLAYEVALSDAAAILPASMVAELREAGAKTARIRELVDLYTRILNDSDAPDDDGGEAAYFASFGSHLEDQYDDGYED